MAQRGDEAEKYLEKLRRISGNYGDKRGSVAGTVTEDGTHTTKGIDQLNLEAGIEDSHELANYERVNDRLTAIRNNGFGERFTILEDLKSDDLELEDIDDYRLQSYKESGVLNSEGEFTDKGRDIVETVYSLAEELEQLERNAPRERFDYEEDVGIIKGSMGGYTIGANPEDEVEDHLDDALEAISSVTSNKGGRTLAIFMEYGENGADVTQSDLSQDYGMTQPNISNKKKKWEEEGLLERTGWGEAEITDKGQVVYETIESMI